MIEKLEKKVLEGDQITYDDAIALSKVNVKVLLDSANRIRKHHCGDFFSLCSIINAKSGRCSENCQFCAQSIHFNTDVITYSLMNIDTIMSQAKKCEDSGISKFSIVTSGRSLSGRDFKNVLGIFSILKRETSLQLCASLGIITYEQAIDLKNAGVTTYHHNLEACRSYFQNICTTHSYDERVKTVQNAKNAGLQVCCGGIIGLGETIEDRILLALEIRELAITSVPVNVLSPIKGTPLENVNILSSDEILKTLAIFRFILPNVFLRFAGGRPAIGKHQENGLLGGVNAAITGDYLSTKGYCVEEDIKMIKRLGFVLT